MQNVIWAEPRENISIGDCYFYHTMDIPHHGIVHGAWDLRGREAAYLGHTSFGGKRVLEIGTASGHLCFTMERMGANVVAYDLSDEQDWDIVPYAGCDYEQHITKRKTHIRRLNNSFWFAHLANKSAARVVYGTVYEIPGDLGQFDICTVGSILLHVRDPFLALQSISAHARETIIVTELAAGLGGGLVGMAEALTGMRLIAFRPVAEKQKPLDAWWRLSPRVVCEILRILGFVHTTVSFHHQLYQNRKLRLFTVVGRRKTAV